MWLHPREFYARLRFCQPKMAYGCPVSGCEVGRKEVSAALRPATCYSLYRTQRTIGETERPHGEAGPTSVEILLQISASSAGAARIKLSGTGIKG